MYQAISAPSVTFLGPDATSQIRALNPAGVEVARFIINGTKKDYTVSRIQPGGQAIAISTCHMSSWSGSSTLTVHGAEAKAGDGSAGLISTEPTFETRTALGGKVKWTIKVKGLSEKKFEVRDSSKVVIARGNLKEQKMEVLVPGDEIMLDCLLAWYVQYVKRGEDSETIASVLDAVGNVAGAMS